MGYDISHYKIQDLNSGEEKVIAEWHQSRKELSLESLVLIFKKTSQE